MNHIPIRHKWEPYVWLLPSLLLMSIFVVFPIVIVFKLSLSDISKSGIVGGLNHFANFRAAFRDPAFPVVMKNTLVWVVSVVGLSTLLGFITAMVLNAPFRGRKIARSIVVFPWATSLVIQASVWNYIIKGEYGNLNNVLLNLGIIKSAVNWRASYQIEFAWECGVGIFVTIPFVAFTVTMAPGVDQPARLPFMDCIQVAVLSQMGFLAVVSFTMPKPAPVTENKPSSSLSTQTPSDFFAVLSMRLRSTHSKFRLRGFFVVSFQNM